LLRWDESANVRRVAHDPTSDGEATVAAFEYVRQRAALPVTVHRKATRIQARPNVKLEVLANELALEADVDVRVSGAPASFIKLALPGWEIVEVQTSALVPEDEIRTDQNNPLVIPFRQPFTGELTLRIIARQSLNAPAATDTSAATEDATTKASSASVTNKQLAVHLPFVQQASNLPTNLRIAAQPNLVVTPLEELVENLIEPASIGGGESATIETSERSRSTESRAYLFRGDPECDQLICSLETKPQELSGELSADVRISNSSVTTVIHVAAQVLHEPIETLRFEFPPQAPTDIAVRLDGQPLDARFHSWAADSSEKTATLIIQLPKPILGVCQLELGYDVGIGNLTQNKPATIAVPLPRSRVGDFDEGPISVASAVGVRSQLAESNWNSTSSTSGEFQVSASRWSETLPLVVQLQPNAARTQKHVIERAYWQTWLTATQRQDRAAYVVATTARSLTLQLPRHANLEGVKVLVNGQVVPHAHSNDATIRCAVTPNDGRVFVELFCPYTARRKQQPVYLPLVENADWTRKLFWQVVMPSNEFLIAPPTGVETEDPWSANDLLSGHQSNVSQIWLENWAGATHQVAPARGMNNYVFSSFGSVPPIQLRTSKRSSLLLFVAGAILGLGLLPSLIPTLQRPVFLIGIAVLMAIAALMFPVHTLLIAPAAGFGVALLATSRAIRWWKQQHVRRPRTGMSDSSFLDDAQAIQDIQAARTTISAMPPLHVSTPDS
jgi:hypothetical protein